MSGFSAQKVTTMSESIRTMVRKPSAFLPVATSLTALALLGGAYIYGRATGQGALVREPDEGSIICGSFSWRDSCPCWHTSPSSGYRERQSSRCACLRYRSELCWLRWHPSIS